MGGKQTNKIHIKRVVLQGDSSSHFLFNLNINHILNELCENNVAKEFCYQLPSDTDPLRVLGFAAWAVCQVT